MRIQDHNKCTLLKLDNAPSSPPSFLFSDKSAELWVLMGMILLKRRENMSAYHPLYPEGNVCHSLVQNFNCYCIVKDGLRLGGQIYNRCTNTFSNVLMSWGPHLYNIREDIRRKKSLTFGHCPKVGGGGGVYRCPNFLALFLPSKSP